MKIGILHLTDIHLTEGKNLIEDRSAKIIGAMVQDFNNITQGYIIITGDIANSGKTSEYNIAEPIFNRLKNTLESLCKNINFKLFMILKNY